ncbi:MAG TPA: PIN domain-containing protein [Anaerolineae bacterium]
MAENNGIVPYVADTHALFWYLTGSPKLGAEAKQAFDEGTEGRALIYLPAIVLAELYFLNEKAGSPLDFAAEFSRLEKSGQFAFIAFQAEDVLDFAHDESVPEMHDRMIVGAARRLSAVCISRDGAIVQSGLVTTVWQ